MAEGRRNVPLGEGGVRPEMGICRRLYAVAEQPAVVCHGSDVRRDDARLYFQAGTCHEPVVCLSDSGGRHVGMHDPEFPRHQTLCDPEQHRAIFGTIIPTAAIILLAALYLFGGHAPAIPFTPKAVLPELNNLTQWMLLAGMMVAIAGIDMPAVHVTDVDNPQKNFPKAILISSIIIIFLSIAGSLSISLIVPPGRLSMASGAAEAFDQMFTAMGARWMTPVMCVFLIWGALTTIITWTLGPSKGLLQVAREGYLPEFWQRRNQYGIPVPILTLQALITTVIGLVIFFMPTISGAFWVMMALSAQLYMIMYMFMFSAAIRLRYSQPDTPRPYSVPCGKPGMWIVAGLGFLTSVLSMTMGFIPPQSIRSEGALKTVLYLLFLTCGMLTFIILPQLLHYYQECRMKKENQPSNNS